MDLLAGELGGGAGGSRAKDAELAKAMFEGSQLHRKKLKLPEMSSAAEHIKKTVCTNCTFALCRARVCLC